MEGARPGVRSSELSRFSRAARTAWLHIGTEKTGTTFLQAFWAANAERFAREGLGVATFLERSFNQHAHHLLAAYCVDADPPQDLHRRAGIDAVNQAEFRRDFRREFLKQVRRGGHERWLFTSELLSTRIQRPDELARLTDLLGEAGLTPRVMVWLRPQEDMLVSTFSTAMISGVTLPFDAAANMGHAARYDYEALLDRWAGAVGEESVSVRDYVAGGAPDALLRQSCELLGLEYDGTVLPERGANESMSYVQAELLRLLNVAVAEGAGEGARVARHRLAHELRAIPGEPLRLTVAERDLVRAHFAEANARLRARWGVELAPVEGRTVESRPERFGAEELVPFLSALLGNVRPRT